MKYRKMEDLDVEVSALGFGSMRMPTIEDDYGNVDEDEAINMIRYAIDQGVNYVDTAWPYHEGESEKVVGKALRDGYREKVHLATKMPPFEVEEQADLDRILNTQLEKLETDCIDFYLLHCITEENWETFQQPEDLEGWIDKVKDEGKIKYIGFSFHDDNEFFKEIIDAYDWDFCQIQYNYLDTEFQAGTDGLKYAVDKGIPVVIMEPLRGGQLAQNLPDKALELIAESGIDRTPADIALQWLWNQPEVSTVLSGMSTMEQVKENVESADNSGINSLSEEELEVVNKLEEVMRGPIGCTRCNYCMPCPNDVNIPQNFALYNQAHVQDAFEQKQEQYLKMDEENRASACIECGQCEPKCPQDLEIMSLLKDVAAYFEE